jgi:hypothetical protein
LTQGATEDYIAWPSKEEKTPQQPAAALAAARGGLEHNVPPAVFAGMLAVFAGGLACRGRGTQPDSKRPLDQQSVSAGRGLGAPRPQRERQPTPAPPSASVPVLHAQCLRPTSTDGQDRTPAWRRRDCAADHQEAGTPLSGRVQRWGACERGASATCALQPRLVPRCSSAAGAPRRMGPSTTDAVLRSISSLLT